MKRVLTVMTIALMWAAVVHAQAALTDKWKEKTTSGLDIELDLTATETALTGTLTRRGSSCTITGGQVSNNTFTFKAKLGDQPEGFTGELVGDEITLWRDRNGRTDAVTLRADEGIGVVNFLDQPRPVAAAALTK